MALEQEGEGVLQGCHVNMAAQAEGCGDVLSAHTLANSVRLPTAGAEVMARLIEVREPPQELSHRPRQNRAVPLPVSQVARRLREAHRPLTRQRFQARLAIETP